MKKLLTALCLLVAMNAMAIDYKWYVGPTSTNYVDYEGQTLQALQMVFCEFVGAESLYLPDPYDSPDAKKATLTYPNGTTEKKAINLLTSFGTEGVDKREVKGIKINCGAAVGANKAQGTYTLTIPAASFNVDGTINAEIVKTFVVADERVYTPVDLGLIPSKDPAVTWPWIVEPPFYFNNRDAEGKPIYQPKGIKENLLVSVKRQSTGTVTQYPLVSDAMHTTDKLGYLVRGLEMRNPDTYTITIPQGIILLTGAYNDNYYTNTEYTVSYTIVDPSAPVVETEIPMQPAPGDVAGLAQIEFSNPDGYKLYLPDEGSELACILTLPDGSTKAVFPTNNATTQGTLAFLNLSAFYTAPGQYKLSIPKGAFELFKGTEMFHNKEINVTYNVVNTTPSDLSFTADPADNSVKYYMDFVKATFAEPVNAVYGVNATLRHPDGHTTKARISFNSTSNRIMADLNYPTEAGDYVLTIPQGVVYTSDYRVNREINLHYTLAVRTGADIPFSVSPAPGKVAELETISIYLPADYTTMSLVNGGITRTYFQGPADQEPKLQYLKMKTSGTGAYIELDARRTADGEYSWTIPVKSINVTDAQGFQFYNNEVVYKWTIDAAGIENLEADTVADVYGIDGRVVLRHATRARIAELERGIYIINGKKIKI